MWSLTSDNQPVDKTFGSFMKKLRKLAKIKVRSGSNFLKVAVKNWVLAFVPKVWGANFPKLGGKVPKSVPAIQLLLQAPNFTFDVLIFVIVLKRAQCHGIFPIATFSQVANELYHGLKSGLGIRKVISDIHWEFSRRKDDLRFVEGSTMSRRSSTQNKQNTRAHRTFRCAHTVPQDYSEVLSLECPIPRYVRSWRSFSKDI